MVTLTFLFIISLHIYCSSFTQKNMKFSGSGFFAIVFLWIKKLVSSSNFAMILQWHHVNNLKNNISTLKEIQYCVINVINNVSQCDWKQKCIWIWQCRKYRAGFCDRGHFQKWLLCDACKSEKVTFGNWS